MTIDSASRHPTTIVDFDHHSREHAVDPAASFEELRSVCPMSYTTSHGGYWVATSYASVFEIVRDPSTFATSPLDGLSPISVPPMPRSTPMVPIELPASEFAAYRTLLHPHMSPKAVREMEPGIAYYAEFFVDRIIDRGEIELLSELAFPAPAAITCDWLGLPTENWEHYATTMHDLLHTPADSPRFAPVIAAFTELLETISGELEARRRAPRQDMLTVIANTPLDGGGPMSEERALGTTMLLMTGGLSTTALLLAHALIHLEGLPDIHARLLADDRFLHTATEELLRFACPITSEGRRVARDVTLEGEALAEGDQVLISWIAANRDPAIFDEPNALRLDRWPNRHLAFGAGPHRCIGSNIGRAMFKALLREILQRMPDYRIVEAIPGGNRGTDNSFESVAVTFTARPSTRSQTTPARQFSR